jgi:hypothetical protein
VPLLREIGGFPDGPVDDILFEVVGNVPGRQDAGVIWFELYDRWLREDQGFTRSVVDRCLYYKFGPGGERITICVYVDDNRIVCTDAGLLAAFEEAWAARFEDSGTAAPPQADISDDFLGIRYEMDDEGVVRLGCEKLFSKLEELLAEAAPASDARDVAIAQKFAPDGPMGEAGLSEIREPPSEDSPLVPQFTDLARRILGVGGWIATNARADPYFSFVALAQQVGFNFTRKVWRALLRWAHYLVHTRDLKLTYRPSKGGAEFYTDSSLFNAAEGGSFGGFAGKYRGSGLFAWRSFVPRKLGLSSGAAELVMTAAATQYVQGFRMMLRELRLDADGSGRLSPTVLFTDAEANLKGTAADRVPKDQRYMAARRAVVRRAKDDGAVDLRAIPTDDNIADLFTKPLTGSRFFHLRDLALGLKSE